MSLLAPLLLDTLPESADASDLRLELSDLPLPPEDALTLDAASRFLSLWLEVEWSSLSDEGTGEWSGLLPLLSKASLRLALPLPGMAVLCGRLLASLALGSWCAWLLSLKDRSYSKRISCVVLKQ